MPVKPKKPCRVPGCPNLTEGTYCPEHLKMRNQAYERFGRDGATRKKYGRAWKRIRDRYAAEHPFCELCFRKGVIRPTEEIHHIRPLSEGGTHDRRNLIALCKSCHSRIHAGRGDYWGKQGAHKGEGGWKSPEEGDFGNGLPGACAKSRNEKTGKEGERWRGGSQSPRP